MVLLWTLGCICLFKLKFSFFLDVCPEIGFLDHMLAPFLVFWEIPMLFPMEAFTNLHSLQQCMGFPFLNTLSRIYISVHSECVLSHVQLFVIPWTVACQTSPSMRFSRQEYWSGLPFHTSGDLPEPGISDTSYVSCIDWQVDSLLLSHPGSHQCS